MFLHEAVRSIALNGREAIDETMSDRDRRGAVATDDMRLFASGERLGTGWRWRR
jgi:hypothetical protein